MANIKITIDTSALFAEAQARIANAATAAMTRVADDVRDAGRADIATAGFSERWQNTLSVRVYPQDREAVDPAVSVLHKIPYSSLFEEGGVVDGQPILWIALPSAKTYFPSGHVTPKRFVQAGYQLASVKDRGNQTPLLAVKTGRRGGRQRSQIVFFGVSRVSIGKKFHIAEICRAAAARLPSYYEQALTDG